MRLLVTGATGFIGIHTVAALAAEGHDVVSSSRAGVGPAGSSRHVAHDVGSAVPFPEVGRLDAIIHLAGNGNVVDARRDPRAIAQINAQGTLNMLCVAREHHARFVLASSQRVYRPRPGFITEADPPDPSEPYGYTKRAAELYVELAARCFGVPAAILRLFTVYGPGQVISSGISGVVAILGQRALQGEPMIVMAQQRKDFVEVSDVVTSLGLAVRGAATPPPTYNIGTGQPTSVLELAQTVKAVTGTSSPIVEEYSEGVVPDQVADIARARRELGFTPRVSLEEGLERYVAWLRSARPRPA
jgi:UDP-glucose 4-epimerase